MIRYSNPLSRLSKTALVDPLNPVGSNIETTQDKAGLNDNQMPGQGVASEEDLDAQDQNSAD